MIRAENELDIVFVKHCATNHMLAKKDGTVSNTRAMTLVISNGIPTSRQNWVIKNYFSYFSTKTYVVGTQKNRLTETVLLSTKC